MSEVDLKKIERDFDEFKYFQKCHTDFQSKMMKIVKDLQDIGNVRDFAYNKSSIFFSYFKGFTIYFKINTFD